MRRVAGSVRFDEYFKVQWYDETTLAWRDIQKAHESVELAESAFIAGKTCRVMVVTEKGRYPLQVA